MIINAIITMTIEIIMQIQDLKSNIQVMLVIGGSFWGGKDTQTMPSSPTDMVYSIIVALSAFKLIAATPRSQSPCPT